MAGNQREHAKKMEEMERVVERQEKRIQSLQSKVHDLTNLYLVFQGVILTAIYRSPTSPIACSDRLLLFALSLLPAIMNTIALSAIGWKYVKSLSHQDQNILELEKLQTSPEDKSLPPKDCIKEAMRYCTLVICIFLFLAFTCVTAAGCLTMPCTRNGCRSKLSEKTPKCIRLCDGPKCIRVMIELPHIFIQTVIYGVIVYDMIGFEWTATKFFWNIFFMHFTLLYFTSYGMMAVAITPNQHISGIVSSRSMDYGTSSLDLLFRTRQRIPGWWKWNYWACPVSWTLYGLVVTQFGDIKEPLERGETVEEFVRSYFGFRNEFVGVVAGIIVGITVLFGFIFAYSIRAFNFQKR